MGPGGGDAAKGVGGRAGLSGDLDAGVGVEHVPYPSADDLVVIHQEYPGLSVSGHILSLTY
ncbi:hypothetical protein TPA0909_47800 [Streptomyces albus]|nr:hypothetical protein TPA0909_47800 [Streptomyces albus]